MTLPPWRKPLRLCAVLVLWRVAWFVLMPVILAYLWHRGRRDPLYSRRIRERFGFHPRADQPPVWIHAVSIGELRSAVPLIRAFLDQGEHVVITNFTPAGLREAEQIFIPEIAQGTVQAGYVPFDYGLAFRRFFRAVRPKFGLVMEVEYWPGMITACRRAGIPLYLCNGQYPEKSFTRDKTRALSPGLLLPGFAGVMVKSEVHAARMRHFGQDRIALTGEMRFEQPIPEGQLAAARILRPAIAADRPVITLSSVVEWEEDLFIDLLLETQKKGSNKPLFVFVPRAPERFDAVAQKLAQAGLRFARRSDVLDETLTATHPPQIDVLLGDSLGEMFFYLALCDLAVAGGGFNPRGSHNIIEPLMLGKPVIVGPEIWTIEYPAREAIAAGVARQVGPDGLFSAVTEPKFPDQARIDAFLATHAGAVEKTLAALDTWGAPTRPKSHHPR
ncbi:3-deoxy-D-manno-octulosonic acid transferase [Rhodalgimonas zhirmunskyi]|uniref:3-deoxy-D-manno-octulosonic acid transferase n=1 Tax=Rhodalgimonas zhirmunskyi TaxID=2964767 RepID=A0AAJ1UE70_9RHOB|nr:glycosyltransferase N-terminal domain-containing protein [Rhodoalgimonas zhirmunskyi]MDQ2094427.1 3-deoxy-D-manno-octulosonic acid transferase [Rhodoalgimonas zhirmunskyi]